MGTVVIDHKMSGMAPALGTGANDAAAGNHAHAQLAALVADYNAKRWGAHLMPDLIYQVSLADVVGTDLPGCYACAIRIKTVFNYHIPQIFPVHRAADTDYTITAADATTLETLIALTLELVAYVPSHQNEIGYHYGGDISAAEIAAFAGLPAVEDAASAATWLNRIKYYYDIHLNSARITDGAEI